MEKFIDKEKIEAAKEILDAVHFASNCAKIDGLRYKITGKPVAAENVYDLYTKSRTEHFTLDERIKILSGYYLLTGERLEKYYFKARAITHEL